MDITFSCSQCGQSIVIDEAGAGIEVQCPTCQTTLTVPTPETASTPAPAVPEPKVEPAVAVLETAPTPAKAEEVWVLTQLCPQCQRAWPNHISVCRHCGTILGSALKGKSAPPSPSRVEQGPRVPSVPAIPIPKAAAPVAPPRPPPPAPPAAPAAAPPVVAVPSAVAPSPDEDQYVCMNPNCGGTWYESQLVRQQVGRKSVQVCPKCKLGVKKLRKQISFWSSVPGAFVYPFRGVGIWVMGLGTLLFAFLDAAKGGFFGLIALALLLGIFGLLMINVIRTTIDDPHEPLDWPEFEGFGQVLGVAFQIVVTVILVFLPTFLSGIMAGVSLFDSEFEAGESAAARFLAAGVWGLAMLMFLLAGVAYFPMAMLGLAMFDSIKGINPVFLIPAMLKVPLQYLFMLALLIIMWFARSALSMMLAALPMWNEAIYIKVALFLPVECFTLYTFVVSARLLGLLYYANAERFGWFPAE